MSKDLIERARTEGTPLSHALADRIKRLEAELKQAKDDTKCAWDNNRILEKARQEEMAKRDKAEAELAERYETIAQLQRNAIDALKAQSEPVAWDMSEESDLKLFLEFGAPESFDNVSWVELSNVIERFAKHYTTPQPSAEDAKLPAKKWTSDKDHITEQAFIRGWNAAIDAARGEE